MNFIRHLDMTNDSTVIPYRASTGREQGFLCVLFLTGKNLFSIQGTLVLIAGTLYSLQGMGLQCTLAEINQIKPSQNLFYSKSRNFHLVSI